jgi:hypothetical protein
MARRITPVAERTGPPPVGRRPGSEEDQELADEAVQAGQADRREGRDEEEGRRDRNDARDAAVRLDLARVAPLVEHPDEEE